MINIMGDDRIFHTVARLLLPGYPDVAAKYVFFCVQIKKIFFIKMLHLFQLLEKKIICITFLFDEIIFFVLRGSRDKFDSS